MKEQPDRLWDLLTAARLVGPQSVVTLRQEAAAAIREGDESIWDWLVAHGVVSTYHRQVLERGVPGPFWYGDFLVLDRVSAPPWNGLFQARHAPSGHLVALEFFVPGRRFRGGTWTSLAATARRLATPICPSLVPTLGTVALPDYSFVVSDWTHERWLPDKVAIKSRLPWESVYRLASDLARGMNALHDQQIAHGQIWPWTIEVTSKSRARLRVTWDLQRHADADPSEKLVDYLAPELLEGGESTMAADVFSWGAVVFRLLTGRSPTARHSAIADKLHALKAGALMSLQKYGAPPAFSELIAAALDVNPEQRPRSAWQALADWSQQTGLLMHEPADFEEPAPSTRDKCRQALQPHDPAMLTIANVGAKPVEITSVEQVQLAVPLDVDPRGVHSRRSRANQWLAPAVAFGALAGFLAILVFGYRYLSQTPGPRGTNPGQSGVAPLIVGDSSAAGEADEAPSASPLPSLVQQVVDDDGQLLWESPTQGAALDIADLPPGLRMVIALRPQAFLADPEGPIVLESLGPELTGWVDRAAGLAGVAIADIEQMVVGLYSSEGPLYTPLFRVTLAAPLPASTLMERWQATSLSSPAGGSDAPADHDALSADSPSSSPLRAAEGPLHFRAEDVDYLVWASHGETHEVRTFQFSDSATIQRAIEHGPRQTPTGALRQLIDATDRDRHLTLVFLSAALFNEEGQALTPRALFPLNRRLRLAFGDTIRGAAMSLHLDQGTYLEAMFNHVPDQRTSQVGESLLNELRLARDEAIAAVEQLPSHPYWDRVRMRLDNMLLDAVRQTRVGQERGQVVFNAWLAPSAAHNLLAANQLAQSMGGADLDFPGSDRSPAATPRTVDELLAIPTSLRVTTNPDLNLLLQMIVDEVRAAHPELPFAFEIRLSGPDLLVEGITQNQRPGDFEMVDQPLAEILTSIMVRANPDKSISGPADENCKLVWVVEPHAETIGGRRVLVTTRRAVAERNLELPPAFRPTNR